MKIYIECTPNLGDFCSSLPVLSGLAKTFNEKITLAIRPEMRKIVGIVEFLRYQDIFDQVNFADEVPINEYFFMSNWHAREDCSNPNRPTETVCYENNLIDRNNIKFEVDDNFAIQVPDLKIEIDQDVYYIGDRWHYRSDVRRNENILQNSILSTVKNVKFLDFTKSVTENAYIIKNSKNLFLSCFTGVSNIADLMYKEHAVLFSPLHWNEEFRRGPRDFSWAGDKNVNQVFAKHYYGDRKGHLVHMDDLVIEDGNVVF